MMMMMMMMKMMMGFGWWEGMRPTLIMGYQYLGRTEDREGSWICGPAGFGFLVVVGGVVDF